MAAWALRGTRALQEWRCETSGFSPSTIASSLSAHFHPCSSSSELLLLGALGPRMSDVPKLRITLLGAGQEVGRSCCVLQYRGRTIVCDAGVHPAYSGIASLPFVDDLDWSTVDVLLITQCVLHLLHI